MFVEKRAEIRRKKKLEGKNVFWDVVAEILCWVPELLILPFRLLLLLLRIGVRAIIDAI